MYCSKCGAPNDDQAPVCSKCATALHEAALDAGTAAIAGTSAVQYAGFWRRLGASLID